MPRVPFAINSYTHESLPLSAQRLVNWFPERAPIDAKTQIALLPHPGLKPFTTVGTGPIRGQHTMAGVLYTVSRNRLYSVDASGTTVDLGNIGTNQTGLVTMADNGTQLVVVNDNDGYVFDKDTSNITKITDPAFQKSTAVNYLDGYHIFAKINSDQFFISGLRDPLSYDALDFATAEGEPDNLVNIAVNSRQLYLCGSETIEVWYNSGADFPFDRLSGAYIAKGLAAKHSIVKLDNTLFWLGHDKKVYRLEGLSARRISTHPIEQALERSSGIGNAEGNPFSYKGHDFYILTIPGQATFVYDAATGLWHERRSFGQPDFRGCCFVEAYGETIVAHRHGNELFTLDANTFVDNGDPLVCSGVGAPYYAAGERLTMGMFEAIFETGVGPEDNSDPQATLRYSDDGGKTWSNHLNRSIGRRGEYEKTVKWHRLGQFEQRVVELSVSDPIGPKLLGVNAEIAA